MSVKKAIIVGRFQPFTDGHLQMYRKAEESFDEVYVGLVKRKKEVYDLENPFSWRQRKAFIQKVLPDVKIFQVPSLYPKKVFEVVGEEVSIVVGGERGEEALAEEHNFFSVPRYDGISATRVRKSILEDNKIEYRMLMPIALWGDFAKMRKIINKYEGDNQ